METKNCLISVNNEAVTVVSPKLFKSGKTGWFGQQKTMIDGKPARIQVIILRDKKQDEIESVK